MLRAALSCLCVKCGAKKKDALFCLILEMLKMHSYTSQTGFTLRSIVYSCATNHTHSLFGWRGRMQQNCRKATQKSMEGRECDTERGDSEQE